MKPYAAPPNPIEARQPHIKGSHPNAKQLPAPALKPEAAAIHAAHVKGPAWTYLNEAIRIMAMRMVANDLCIFFG